MNHKGTVTLETERLILRRFKIDDAENMYNNWASNDNVTKFLTWKSHSSVDETKYVLNMWIESYNSPDSYQWCIELKENSQPIGSIGIVKMNEETSDAVIGYCISEDYWRKGITTEALKRVMKYLFEDIGFNRITSYHDSNNPNSGKVMAKSGLKYEGTYRKSDVNNTGICDMVVYGLLKEDYFESIK